MTYKVYIRKDYKPISRRLPVGLASGYRWSVALFIFACLIFSILFVSRSENTYQTTSTEKNFVPPAYSIYPDTHQNTGDTEPETLSLDVHDAENPDSSLKEYAPIADQEPTIESVELTDEIIPDSWDSLQVASGDNLSLIFDRMKISPQVLHEIMSLGKEVFVLKKLMPDHEIRFQFMDGELDALQYDVNLTDILQITRQDNTYEAETIKIELDTRISLASGEITDSLFLTAQRAGLSDNLTMQLVELYGWDIDFALDIRKGDRFYVVYEEKFKEGEKIQTGPILSAEFINRNKSFRAVRYTHADGYVSYYNQDGLSMRKAFLRTPVKYSRISSRFNLSRKHPILNKIRAHRGVDYAAPTGTPIKATGDGVIDFAGNKGGYGRVVVLRHGEKYSTLYGHMSRFAKNIRAGRRVKQGQTLGYVGMSGLATGPHLHYEFLVNGIHRNPLTVDLPKAISIPADQMADFNAQSQPLFALLDEIINKTGDSNKPVIALIDKSHTSTQAD